jgi:hemolysin III
MKKDHTVREISVEKMNSFSHGLGVLFGLIFMPMLILPAYKNQPLSTFTGSVIYSFCFILLFTASTLYHGFNQPKLKERLKILDHISIYFLIAGTYTPFILIYVNNTFGITLLAILWGLTLIGIFFKLYFTGRFELVSTGIYVLMGWILFVGGKSFFKEMPVPVIALLAAGGVIYSLGVIFYLWKTYTYHHVIWHLFVLAAAVCHYAAVLISV